MQNCAIIQGWFSFQSDSYIPNQVIVKEEEKACLEEKMLQLDLYVR